jgi:hypothetical protein
MRFYFRKKSLIGLVFGFVLGIVGIWISFEFNLTLEQVSIYLFISLIVIGTLMSSFRTDIISNGLGETKEQFKTQLKELSVPEEKKKLILKWSGKINFDLYDLNNLIKSHGIEDDEFWISFFLDNIKEIPEHDRNNFYRFLVELKSEESKEKLKSILLSKGILIEDKFTEYRERILKSLKKER